MLTQEELKEMLDYCPRTGMFTWNIRPANRMQVGDIAGGKCSFGHINIRVYGKKEKAHRLAWLYVYGEWPPGYIDHINRIPWDNRIENLRVVTHTENMQNKSLYKNSNTGVPGVQFKNSKWVARIQVEGQRIALGTFPTIEEAIQARQDAERKYGFIAQ